MKNYILQLNKNPQKIELLSPFFSIHTPNPQTPTQSISTQTMASGSVAEHIHNIARDYASLMWSSMLNGIEQHPTTIAPYNKVKTWFLEHMYDGISHDHVRKFIFAYLFGHSRFTYQLPGNDLAQVYEFDPEMIGPHVVATSIRESDKIQSYFNQFSTTTDFPIDELYLLATHIHTMLKEHFSHYTETFTIVDIASTPM